MRPRVFFYSGGPNLWFVFWMIAIGAAAITAAAVWGLAQVVEGVFPFLERFAVLGLGLFAVGIVPFSLVREWRPRLSGLGFALAAMYRLGIWMASFLLLWKWVGFFAAPAVLIWPLAAPAAIIGLLIKSDWNQAAALLASVAVARGMRLYSAWLAGGRPSGSGRPFRGSRSGAEKEDATVIETVVVETSETGASRQISNDSEFK